MGDFFSGPGNTWSPGRSEGYSKKGNWQEDREKKIEIHPDFDNNTRQAKNLIKHTQQRWANGMLITMSGGCVTFSYQRPELAPTFGCPVDLNQANHKFKSELQSAYRYYHELALAKNREIAQIDLPTPKKGSTSGSEGARIQVALAA
jgi:hypothetical protein